LMGRRRLDAVRYFAEGALSFAMMGWLPFGVLMSLVSHRSADGNLVGLARCLACRHHLDLLTECRNERLAWCVGADAIFIRADHENGSRDEREDREYVGRRESRAPLFFGGIDAADDARGFRTDLVLREGRERHGREGPFYLSGRVTNEIAAVSDGTPTANVIAMT